MFHTHDPNVCKSYRNFLTNRVSKCVQSVFTDFKITEERWIKLSLGEISQSNRKIESFQACDKLDNLPGPVKDCIYCYVRSKHIYIGAHIESMQQIGETQV